MRALTLIAIATFSISAGIPDPSTCGPWVPQTNGSKWRMCTDANKQTYCEMKLGRTITRFDCGG
jgi:hypothetical protein